VSKVLIVTGQFAPYTKSLGGILRVYSFINTLKEKHQIFLLASKCPTNINYGYLGLKKKELKNINISYLKNSSIKIVSSIFNFKIFRNIFYLLGFDYAININDRYLNKCIEIIKRKQINYLIISSPPFSLFYLVQKIKSEFKNIKIILDYRDGWSTRVNNIYIKPLQYIIQNFIEKKILNQSNFILTATDQISKKIKYFYKKKSNIFLVRNGFLYKPKLRKKINKKIKIGYFGLISEDSTSYRNINIIYEVFKKNKLLQKKFVFEFYGNNTIRNNNIKSFSSFKFKKNIVYKQALTKMTEMDYLLIIHTEKSTAKEMVTTKFYDYLASGTHILNISSGKNEVGYLIKKFKLGFNVNYEKKNLENFFLELKVKKNKIKWKNKFNFFSRKFQNKRLLKIIN